jgi:hypothetical protein
VGEEGKPWESRNVVGDCGSRSGGSRLGSRHG